MGYGKTGSTAIQEWLAGQQHALEGAGVAYPIPKEGVGDSGNGSLLVAALAQPTEHPWWLEELRPGIKGVLFSREHLARELSKPGCCELLADCARRWGFGSIKILLFVRDPREHCYSLWAQKVKRAGECRSLAAFAEEYDVITMATSFMTQALDSKIFLRIFDYGQHKDDLLPLVAKWLFEVAKYSKGFDLLKDLTDLHTDRINATPIYSQLILQRHLNAIWPGGKAPVPSKRVSRLLFPVFSGNSIKYKSSLIKKWELELRSLNQALYLCKGCEFLDIASL